MKKTRKTGPGRPKKKKNEVLGSVITIRMDRAERKVIEGAVVRSGGKLSKWARAALLNAARDGKVSEPKPEDAGIEPHGVVAPKPEDVKPC